MKKQRAGEPNKQDRMTAAEQLCSAGHRHCGVFWAQWLAVTDASLAIYQSHLSAVRREELWSSFTLPPGLSPVRKGRERLKLGPHVCERSACQWKKNIHALKTWLKTLPRSVGEPASLAFGSSTTTYRAQTESQSSPSWYNWPLAVSFCNFLICSKHIISVYYFIQGIKDMRRKSYCKYHDRSYCCYRLQFQLRRSDMNFIIITVCDITN